MAVAKNEKGAGEQTGVLFAISIVRIYSTARFAS